MDKENHGNHVPPFAGITEVHGHGSLMPCYRPPGVFTRVAEC